MKYSKPQINAGERRFVHLDIQPFSEVYPVNGLTKSPQSTQRAQISAMPVITYVKAALSRFRTRIARIFTDPCASAQSVFHCTPSAFIMPKPCGFSDRNLTVLNSQTTPTGICVHAGSESYASRPGTHLCLRAYVYAPSRGATREARESGRLHQRLILFDISSGESYS
jgi:hypothetical protein